MQLLPDIPIIYDDDSHIPGLTFTSSSTNQQPNQTPTATTTTTKWAWLVCCGAFFLIDVSLQRIYASEDIVELIAHFLWTTGRSLQAAAIDEEEEADINIVTANSTEDASLSAAPTTTTSTTATFSKIYGGMMTQKRKGQRFLAAHKGESLAPHAHLQLLPFHD